MKNYLGLIIRGLDVDLQPLISESSTSAKVKRTKRRSSGLMEIRIYEFWP